MTMPRNRIRELRYVQASTLIPNPANWRRHPKAQRDALQAMLDRVGWADAVIARETPEGLVLVDGHLRADLDANAEVPVLVVDLDEAEAGQVLATLDPLAAMAEANTEALKSLVDSIAAQTDQAMAAVLEDVHSLVPELLDIEGYEPMDFDREEVADEDGDFVMIQFSIPRQHRQDIIRRIEPILEEYQHG